MTVSNLFENYELSPGVQGSRMLGRWRAATSLVMAAAIWLEFTSLVCPIWAMPLLCNFLCQQGRYNFWHFKPRVNHWLIPYCWHQDMRRDVRILLVGDGEWIVSGEDGLLICCRGCREEHNCDLSHQRSFCRPCAWPNYCLQSDLTHRHPLPQVQHIVPEVTIPPEVTPENVTTYIVDSGGELVYIRVSCVCDLVSDDS